MMITSSEPTIARWRLAGGAIGKRTSARPRRTWNSLFMITGQAPRWTQTSATARASSSRSSSQMIVTTSPSSIEKQTSTISAASSSTLSVTTAVAIASPHSFGRELGKHFVREALDLAELVDRAEAADEVVDAGVGERANPLRDLLRRADGPPVRQVHRLRQLGVVLLDVIAEVAPRLFLGLADVHRHLIGDRQPREVVPELVGHAADPVQLLDELVRMLCPATGQPAVSVADDAPACGTQPPLHHIGRRVAGEPRVGDDPHRRRLLDRLERLHLGPGVERDVVVVEVLAVERHRPLRPERAQDGEALLEDRALAGVVEAERLELASHAVLGVAGARAEDRPAAGD